MQPDYRKVDRTQPHTFLPVLNESPTTLSSSQIAHFNEYGFIEKLHLFNKVEADRHRRHFDSLLEEFQRRNHDAYAISGYQTQINFIWDIATHPLLLDHVEDLIGPNILFCGRHYFCKMPSDQSEVPFHQDASYWLFRPFMTIAAFDAVDDVVPDMGPMYSVPDSHQHAERTWSKPRPISYDQL